MRQLILILFLIYVCASDLKITTVEMVDLQLNIFCREISTMLLCNIEDATSSNTSPIIILSFHRKIQEPRQPRGKLVATFVIENRYSGELDSYLYSLQFYVVASSFLFGTNPV